MLARTESVALIGADARLVEVEIDVAESGLPGFRIVGLPAKSVTEAEQRVRGALESIDQKWPQRRMTANLAPGALRKEGTHFDLPLALGVISAAGSFPPERLGGWIVIGELALEGSVRTVRGALAAAIACKLAGRRGVICPAANAAEAAAIDGIEVVPVSNLAEAVRFAQGDWEPPGIPEVRATSVDEVEDISEVRGHADAKRALEVAAAGGHNLVMLGPPGSGKTMLARRLPGIIPELSPEEAIDVTRVYSVAGLLDENASLLRVRPLRAPHHHVSLAGMIGGGSGLASPGEVSLAHHGVLFLDELPLFRSAVLESLRAPLEDGSVRLARSGGVVMYPARFSLIAAMNPCPCGYGDQSRRRCRCTNLQLQHYRNRLSGPLMDRFDIQILMGRPTRKEFTGPCHGDRSAEVRRRVERARAVQVGRYGPGTTNASCTSASLMQRASLTPDAASLLSDALDGESLTGRGYVRVIRVARTIADLAEEEQVSEEAVAHSLRLRNSSVGKEAERCAS